MSRAPGCWSPATDARRCCCAEKNPERELWEGARLGSAAAPAALGVDQACPLDSLDEVVRERLAGQAAVWIPFGTTGLQARLDGWLEALRAQARNGVGRRRRCATCAAARRDAPREGAGRAGDHAPRGGDLAPARMCARCATARPASAPIRTARCTNTRSRPSCCTSSAATAPQCPAYASIVAAGANACVLHYRARRRAGARGRAVPDRRRLRARRLRQRHHPHLPGRRPLQRAAARALRARRWRRRQAAIAATRPGARQRDAHARRRARARARACSTSGCSTAAASATSTP